MSVATEPLHRHSTQRAWQDAVALVISRMRDRPQSPLNLSEMARLAGVSRCHFDRLFRNVSGVSPRQFQTSLRLNMASRLLLTTNLRVTQICFDLGYESLGSFTTKFTETFGLSPQRLRELAAALDRPWPKSLMANVTRTLISSAQPPLLEGDVTLDSPSFDGLIFIGLFPSRLPVRTPLACTILDHDGHFVLGPIPSVTSYLFAIATPWCDSPLEFLRNDRPLRDGGIHIAPHTSTAAMLRLRRPLPTDPPINVVLPYLIAERIFRERDD